MKKKIEKIGELSLHTILVNQRITFYKATKIEGRKKKVRREKERNRRIEIEDSCVLKIFLTYNNPLFLLEENCFEYFGGRIRGIVACILANKGS